MRTDLHLECSPLLSEAQTDSLQSPIQTPVKTYYCSLTWHTSKKLKSTWTSWPFFSTSLWKSRSKINTEWVHTIHAVLHMSVGGPYSAPISTSRARYWRVWMSSVKCLCWCGGEDISKHHTSPALCVQTPDVIHNSLSECMELTHCTHHPACIA